jgi:hypothetical protein
VDLFEKRTVHSGSVWTAWASSGKTKETAPQQKLGRGQLFLLQYYWAGAGAGVASGCTF